jgi:UDP-glucose 4-epimerase|tara:strand:+ start:97 stop:966 length:870 start_codon:yes stop_codon:yes gene_type:complete
MSKRIIIFGGAGFIGRAVALNLLSNGFEDIIIFDNKDPKISGIKFIKGDILCQEDFLTIPACDIVLNYAAIANLDDSLSKIDIVLDVNIQGVINTLKYAAKNNIDRYIFASSMYVFGENGNFYGATKKCGEILVEEFALSYGFDFTHIRYGSLYGPGAQDWNSIKKYIHEIKTNKKISFWGSGDEKREYIHIDDAADLTVKTFDKSYANIAVTLTGQEQISSKQMLELVFEILDIEPDIEFRNEVDGYHYKLTPYKFLPMRSYKMNPGMSIDLSQGIVDVLNEDELVDS